MADVVVGIAVIDGQNDGAHLDGSKQRAEIVNGTPHSDRDDIARCHARIAHVSSDVVRQAVEFAIGDGPAGHRFDLTVEILVDDRNCLRIIPYT
nr:hypothetical protein [Sinorhizobium medicae]